MATNKDPFKFNFNTYSTKPLIVNGLFQAGSTQAVKRGEILEFTGNTNAAWVPWDSDADITVGIAVAACEIKSGDRAGYYPIIVPRLGDVFQFVLATASALAQGTSMTYSDSQTLTTGGSHVMGFAYGYDHYPYPQGHLADDAAGDLGTTVRSTPYVDMVFKISRSWYTVMNWDGA